MTPEELAAHLEVKLGAAVQGRAIAKGELTLKVEPAEIVRVLTALRDDAQCLFQVLIDICGVDWPARKERFDVVYHLLSPRLNQRIRLKLTTDEQTPVPSTVGVFPASNWFEREAFDLYGVVFTRHPDLRRILTDYGFIGNPFRKDFPLSGNVEMRYDPDQQRVIYQPVSIEPRQITPRVIREEHYGDSE